MDKDQFEECRKVAFKLAVDFAKFSFGFQHGDNLISNGFVGLLNRAPTVPAIGRFSERDFLSGFLGG